MKSMVTVLAGGVGGAKLVVGLADLIAPERLTVIGNTGDDVERHGLWVSPDLDILTYSLAGVVDESRGWGYRNETFRVLETLRGLGEETWMNLGDQDLATHLLRTELRRKGIRPTVIAGEIARRLGVSVRILPPTDHDLQTRVRTPEGWMNFQEFYIREQCRPKVLEVRVEGAAASRATAEAAQALEEADLLVFAPSNPVASLGPILAVPGIREAIARCRGRRVAVAPLVGGACLKGPTLQMMQAQGQTPDLLGIADLYAGLIDDLLIDPQDAQRVPALEAKGLRVQIAHLVLRGREEKRALAATLLARVGS